MTIGELEELLADSNKPPSRLRGYRDAAEGCDLQEGLMRIKLGALPIILENGMREPSTEQSCARIDEFADHTNKNNSWVSEKAPSIVGTIVMLLLFIFICLTSYVTFSWTLPVLLLPLFFGSIIFGGICLMWSNHL